MVTALGAAVVLFCPASSLGVPGHPHHGLHAGGRLDVDPGFDAAHAVAVQSDGKIIAVGGGTYEPPTATDFALARYTADGSPDATFGAGGKVTTDFGGGSEAAFAMALQADGKIIAAGSRSTNEGGGEFALARYTADGSLDTTFGAGGRVTTAFGGDFAQAFAMRLQADGKIVAVGHSGTFGSVDFALARYDTDGGLDAGFGAGGTVTTDIGGAFDSARAAALQADGKIIAAGYGGSAGTDDFALVRYDTDGAPDTTFGTDGRVLTRRCE
ncbi:delta-60 repeat domain-containing protein [Streptomyces sp. NPDC093225]|uniref:delta-60 repeat domain-containing protein n=1 Tax=Streptomyces sp. NPDC093225 TaxID=3366034 RepID=UPI00382FFA0E